MVRTFHRGLKSGREIIRATAYAAIRDIRSELERTKERTSNGGDKESNESKSRWRNGCFSPQGRAKGSEGAAEVLGDDVSALPAGGDNASISMSSDGYGADEVEESEELEASAELGGALERRLARSSGSMLAFIR